MNFENCQGKIKSLDFICIFIVEFTKTELHMTTG